MRESCGSGRDVREQDLEVDRKMGEALGEAPNVIIMILILVSEFRAVVDWHVIN